MKIPILASIVSILVLSAPVFAESSSILKKHDIATWVRTDAKLFGCFLETEFGYRDKKFNCALKTYENKGDPCKKIREYAEGPRFPASKVAIVNKRFKSIELTWEHGDLQQISITLQRKFKEKEVRANFKLPKDASIQDCSLKDTCIVLLGFDHQGAGDVDCSEQ